MVEMRRVIVYAVILAALALLVGAYMGMIYAQDQNRIEYEVTYNVVEGDPTEHLMTFDVMVVSDGVDVEQVERAILMCPNVFGYTMVENDPSSYYYTSGSFWEGYGGIPFPNQGETYTILVVDREEYPDCQAAGVTIPPNGWITVIWEEGWSDMITANVITHECAHQIETDDYVDYMDENIGAFDEWLVAQNMGTYPCPNQYGWMPTYTDFVIDKYLTSSGYCG